MANRILLSIDKTFPAIALILITLEKLDFVCSNVAVPPYPFGTQSRTYSKTVLYGSTDYFLLTRSAAAVEIAPTVSLNQKSLCFGGVYHFVCVSYKYHVYV